MPFNVCFHCSVMSSTGDKCSKAPAVQGIYRSERASWSLPLCLAAVGPGWWGSWGEAPRGKGKCPTGLDICVPEALEQVFIVGCLALCPLSSLTGSWRWEFHTWKLSKLQVALVLILDIQGLFRKSLHQSVLSVAVGPLGLSVLVIPALGSYIN